VRWVVLAPFLLVGCASVPLTHDQCNATKFSTAMEHHQCLVGANRHQEELDAKEDKRLVRRDELIAFLNQCDRAEHLVVMEIIKSGRSQLPNKFDMKKAMREWGYRYTHNNVNPRARIHDFSCVSSADLKEILRRAGY